MLSDILELLCHLMAASFEFACSFDYAALVVEQDHPVPLHGQIGDDEADLWEQLARMPFDLGNDTVRLVPTPRLIYSKSSYRRLTLVGDGRPTGRVIQCAIFSRCTALVGKRIA